MQYACTQIVIHIPWHSPLSLSLSLLNPVQIYAPKTFVYRLVAIYLFIYLFIHGRETLRGIMHIQVYTFIIYMYVNLSAISAGALYPPRQVGGLIGGSQELSIQVSTVRLTLFQSRQKKNLSFLFLAIIYIYIFFITLPYVYMKRVLERTGQARKKKRSYMYKRERKTRSQTLPAPRRRRKRINEIPYTEEYSSDIRIYPYILYTHLCILFGHLCTASSAYADLP